MLTLLLMHLLLLLAYLLLLMLLLSSPPPLGLPWSRQMLRLVLQMHLLLVH